MQPWLFHQINHQHFNQAHLLRFSKWSFQRFSKWSFQRLSKRSFRTTISCTLNGLISRHFLRFLISLSASQFRLLPPSIRAQQTGHRWRGLREKSKTSREGLQTVKKTKDQDARDQGEISGHDDLIKHGGFSLIFKVVSVSVQFNIHFHGVWLTFRWAHGPNVCTAWYS